MQHRGSIFSQKLDRVAFIAYFLGAVVPLVALGVVVDRFVFPAVRDRLAIWGLVGAVGCIAVLSFAAFLVLRRTTRAALDQTQRDNRRLAALLELAGSMAVARHGDDAAETAARGILGLTDATAGFVMARGEPGAAPVRLAAAGDGAEKLEREIVEPMVELVRIVLDGGRPASRGADAAGPEMLCAPLPGFTCRCARWWTWYGWLTSSSWLTAVSRRRRSRAASGRRSATCAHWLSACVPISSAPNTRSGWCAR